MQKKQSIPAEANNPLLKKKTKKTQNWAFLHPGFFAMLPNKVLPPGEHNGEIHVALAEVCALRVPFWL